MFFTNAIILGAFDPIICSREPKKKTLMICDKREGTGGVLVLGRKTIFVSSVKQKWFDLGMTMQQELSLTGNSVKNMELLPVMFA